MQQFNAKLKNIVIIERKKILRKSNFSNRKRCLGGSGHVGDIIVGHTVLFREGIDGIILLGLMSRGPDCFTGL